MKNATDATAEKPHTIVISGLGGIGKTQLARKFIHRNELYTNAVWINSEDRIKMEQNLRELAEEMNIPVENKERDRDFISIAQAVLNKLSTSPTLMVFDNVETKEHCKFLFTMGTPCEKPHILITSRIHEWGDSVHHIKLDVFEPGDAVEFVSRVLLDSDGLYNDSLEEKITLAETLQNFPLALRQVTAFINDQRTVTTFRIVDYIKKWNSAQQALLDSTVFQNDIGNTYAKTTFTTWKVTIDAINQYGEVGELALRIFNIIAHFDPDHIRRDVFFNLKVLSPFGRETIEENVTVAVRLLVNYSLVDSQASQSVLSIHRLVQQVTKIELENRGQTKQFLRDGLCIISKMKNDKNFREFHEHAISVFISALKFNELVAEFSSFPAIILRSLLNSGKSFRAKIFGNQILQTLPTILGEDHQDIITSKYYIARSYRDLGKYSKALEIFEEVFKKRKNILGEFHSETLISLNGVALSYLDLGRHSEALQMFEEIFQKRKEILGRDHPHTLYSMNNIARSYRVLGKHSKALQIFKEVFNRRKSILGADHPHTVVTMNDITSSYLDLGKHDEGLQVFKEVFEKRKHILGEDHPHTLISMNGIARSYRELGKHSEALQMFETVLEKRTKILGEDHPDTLVSKSDTACTYSDLGKHFVALQMFEEVFRKRKQFLGEDHPHTLYSMNDIARTLQQLDKHSEALGMSEKGKPRLSFTVHALILSIKFMILSFICGLCLRYFVAYCKSTNYS